MDMFLYLYCRNVCIVKCGSTRLQGGTTPFKEILKIASILTFVGGKQLWKKSYLIYNFVLTLVLSIDLQVRVVPQSGWTIAEFVLAFVAITLPENLFRLQQSAPQELYTFPIHRH